MGARLDRLGSKPVLTIAIGAWLLIGAGWILMAGKFFAPGLVSVVALLFATGLTAAVVDMARMRLLMAVVPRMGRDHFFAYYSVVTNLALGLSPVFWGLFIDCFHEFHGAWHGMEWNRFSLFFLGSWIGFAITLLLTRWLVEPHAASMDEHVPRIPAQNVDG